MIKKTAIFIIIALFAIQFIPIDKTNPPVDETLTLKAPTEVMSVLKKSCYDCHSNETKWPWYSDIAPISFAVALHVKDGKNALNFSEWKNIDKTTKIERVKRAIVTVKNERMAPESYVKVHEYAKLNQEKKDILVTWFEKELSALHGTESEVIFQVR